MANKYIAFAHSFTYYVFDTCAGAETIQVNLRRAQSRSGSKQGLTWRSKSVLLGMREMLIKTTKR